MSKRVLIALILGLACLVVALSVVSTARADEVADIEQVQQHQQQQQQQQEPEPEQASATVLTDVAGDGNVNGHEEVMVKVVAEDPVETIVPPAADEHVTADPAGEASPVVDAGVAEQATGEAAVEEAIPAVPTENETEEDADEQEPATAGLTTRTHTLHLEQLTPSADETGREVVLVSIADRTTLHVPASELHGKKAGARPEEFLIFDEDFDPLWYYVMKERDFTDVEWSGCGGKWRPEWSVPYRNSTQDAEEEALGTLKVLPSVAALAEAEGFALLKHFLAHHVVCSFSSVSFCSASKAENDVLHPREASDVNYANKNVHFQWAAQFISTLTSSPLSFTVDTPRHIRPTGVVLETDEEPAVGDSVPSSKPWCSYHLVYHDTLCTQQISPLLQQGKYHKELKEETINGLPRKLIFNNVVASLFDFFATPFHHFHFSVKRTTSEEGDVAIEVVTRMTFVIVDETQTARLVEHWQKVLRQHADTEEQRRLFKRLSIFIGPGGIPSAMRAALPEHNIKLDLASPEVQRAAAASSTGRTWASIDQPEVTYEVNSIGKDHGYYSVYLNPARTFFQEHHHLIERYAHAPEEQNAPLRVGDEVRTLMMFPLHLIRPRFYNFESFLGSSVLENFRVDKDSNTLLVMVRTPITEDHVRAFNTTFSDTPVSRQTGKPNPHERNHEHPLLLLARFQFQHGWGALKDVPRDANRFSIVPQPIVKVERRLPSAAVPATAAECAAVCDRIGFDSELLTAGTTATAAHSPFIDHQTSLLKMMRALSNSSLTPGAPVPAEQCSCHRMLRSALSAGSFLPAPDAAMVFNVLALGLTFASLAMSFFFRSYRKLNCRSKDLIFVEKGIIAE